MCWKWEQGNRIATLGLVLVLLGALIIGAGCKVKKTPPQPLNLDGAWISNEDGSRLVFREKGRFVLLPAGHPEKKIRGAVRQGAGKVTFRNAPDSQVCVGVEGIYTPSLDGPNLTLAVVKDDCSSRRQLMTKGFKRATRKKE